MESFNPFFSRKIAESIYFYIDIQIVLMYIFKLLNLNYYIRGNFLWE